MSAHFCSGLSSIAMCYSCGMVTSQVPMPLDEEALAAAARRRERLNAAIAAKGITVAELHRRLVESGERELAYTTVNAWCTGRTPVRQLVLAGVLAVLGFPADWAPPTQGSPVKQGRSG
jgi:hypothetical protein